MWYKLEIYNSRIIREFNFDVMRMRAMFTEVKDNWEYYPIRRMEANYYNIGGLSWDYEDGKMIEKLYSQYLIEKILLGDNNG